MTVPIERLAAGGDGVGKAPTGKVVFVSRTCPGDVAEVEITQEKARHAHAKVLSLKVRGAERVVPECAHYTDDRCGGCQWQHVSLKVQREAKSRLVGDALRRIGGLDIADPEIVPSSVNWRYRSKITLTVKRGSGGRKTWIGLRRQGEPGRVFDLRDCKITGERIVAVWDTLSKKRALIPDFVDSIVLKEDREGRIHVVLQGGREVRPLGPLAEAVGLDQVTYWWQPLDGAARAVHGQVTGYPALAFEQSNRALADTIRRRAVKGLKVGTSDKVAWDLYGGVGDTARMLAKGGLEVWSLDSDRAAVAWAEKAFGDPKVHMVAEMVETGLSRLPKPDLVVVNPPRTGMAEKLARTLNNWALESENPRLAYISCNPATLARDLSKMDAFRVSEVTAFDLFPHTSHVETLAILGRAS